MSIAVNSLSVETKVYEGQKPGTSGLRKAVRIFQQEHYTENFVQAILDALGSQCVGCTLVVGGDGRYYGKDAVKKIIRITAANGVRRLIVGQNGILSTPAVSAIIRKYKTQGGIVLTASHNPGGPNADFGIKFNCENGGPAPDGVTNEIYEITKTLKSYKIIPEINVDIDKIQNVSIQVDGKPFDIDIIDSVNDYLELMKNIFDFASIKSLLQGSKQRPAFKVLINGMNGVTGPYIKRIFSDELGVDNSSLVNITPLEDFGGLHPDPNLTYAIDLVNAMKNNPKNDFGAAFDGDGDRNMILGKNAFFVTPTDSLAVLSANLKLIPYFQKTGVKGYARSMPTGAAVDRVALKGGVTCFEVPTGWKYFGNLMDAGRLSLCGEESFGTGSDHIREKDGIWACLAWLNVIAKLGKSVQDVLLDHWKSYGRNFFTRYDYENCEVENANKVMQEVETAIQKAGFVGTTLSSGNKTYTVKLADNYSYTDPIDGSQANKQGLRILFEDGSRIIYRLSGTGSSGATIRLYIDSYENDPSVYEKDAQQILKPLVNIALDLSKLSQHTGRDAPTVIT
ncbi:phosphoglucomutase [Vespa crabro]|uniref:phosphoglucomutase n=1 Tax=Vespa crabro TaxID=7445 RepID=UPI001F00F71E|nr:phosphoglucomutase [Vespa crabro]